MRTYWKFRLPFDYVLRVGSVENFRKFQTHCVAAPDTVRPR